MKTPPNQTAFESAPDKRNSTTPGELFSELSIEKSSPKEAAQIAPKFTGTDNPRHLRVIISALVRSRKREEIDRIAGASNGPELIAELRRRGLEFPCDRVPAIDRDGYLTRPGVYHLTDADRRKVTTWQRLRDAVKGCA